MLSNILPLPLPLPLPSGPLLLRIFGLHLAAERGYESSIKDYPRSDPILRHQVHLLHLLGEADVKRAVAWGRCFVLLSGKRERTTSHFGGKQLSPSSSLKACEFFRTSELNLISPSYVGLQPSIFFMGCRTSREISVGLGTISVSLRRYPSKSTGWDRCFPPLRDVPSVTKRLWY